MKMEMVLDDEIGRRTDRRTDGTIAPAGAASRKQTDEGSINEQKSQPLRIALKVAVPCV